MRYNDKEMTTALLEFNRFVCIDIETTGFMRNRGAEIIEVGAVLIDVKKNRYVKEFSSFVKPRISKIPEKITRLTGIKQEDVEDAPYIEDVIPRLRDFIGDYPIVFHNALFDWDRFLDPLFAESGYFILNPVIDTYTIAKAHVKECEKKNLAGLVEFFGGNMTEAHRALIDSKYSGGVVKYMKRYLETKDIEKVTLPLLEKKDAPNLYIKNVKCWAKAKHKRIYVESNLGTFYYSLNTERWYVKLNYVGADIRFSDVETKFLKYVSLDSMNAVRKYFEENIEKIA